MNDSSRNKEVEYCSRVIYIVLRPNTNSRKIPGFHRGGAEGVQSQDATPDPPCIIIIYLEYT